MVNLIEHVSDPRGVLAQAAQLLTENGRMLIKTPNYKSLDERIFHRHSWEDFIARGISCYSQKRVSRPWRRKAGSVF